MVHKSHVTMVPRNFMLTRILNIIFGILLSNVAGLNQVLQNFDKIQMFEHIIITY